MMASVAATEAWLRWRVSIMTIDFAEVPANTK